ncbi:rho GTPase-activating protein 5-like [Salvia miltiorrhiza]|uniref:rho GTPase-activating protein 5-like n=1 Tax=Salvia miltiorrhiza TaxID=226208 RepID=UPI0025AD95CD|nr:rho GTPase-activating protein 5-like [Salvia miltiorrhiza]
MVRLFRSKSCSLNSMPPPLYEGDEEDDDDDGYFGDLNTDEDDEDEDEEEDGGSENPATTPFLSPGGNGGNQSQFSVLGVVAAALRKSLVTCSVDTDDVASDVDIGWPTDVRHVSHVTFDRFNGFLGLPLDLQPDVPPKPPSASASVFGVSAQSMQCSFDSRGNSVPTILLRMQSRLYSEGGLQAEGIFRINAENSQEENVRQQLNKGVVPHGIDVHCLSGLIKAWFRELPSGVLDCLRAEEVMHCNTEEECSELVKKLPPTEAALLDWAINLMADVVHHHQHNKMNARNIAMVFAPNMTQMADPLTALIHAVQVMNFLKTLIGKTLAQRQSSGVGFDECCSSTSSCTSSSTSINNAVVMSKSDATSTRKRRTLGHSFKDEYEAEDDGFLHRLSLRKGMQKLCRHPVFHLTKTLHTSN